MDPLLDPELNPHGFTADEIFFRTFSNPPAPQDEYVAPSVSPEIPPEVIEQSLEPQDSLSKELRDHPGKNHVYRAYLNATVRNDIEQKLNLIQRFKSFITRVINSDRFDRDLRKELAEKAELERQQEESRRRLLNSSSSTLAYMSGGGDYDEDEERYIRRKRKERSKQREFEDRRNREMMKRMRR